MATWFDTRDQQVPVDLVPSAVTPARTVRLAIYGRDPGENPQRRGSYLGSLELDVEALRHALGEIEALLTEAGRGNQSDTNRPTAQCVDRKDTELKKPPKTSNRRRCRRCGLLWPQFAGPYCTDCDHQIELPLVNAAAEPPVCVAIRIPVSPATEVLTGREMLKPFSVAYSGRAEP